MSLLIAPSQLGMSRTEALVAQREIGAPARAMYDLHDGARQSLRLPRPLVFHREGVKRVFSFRGVEIPDNVADTVEDLSTSVGE